MHWALGGVNVGGGDGSGWKVKLKGHVEVEQRALYTAQDRRRRTKDSHSARRTKATRGHVTVHSHITALLFPQNKDLSSSLYHLGDRLRISDSVSRANA